MAADAEIKRHLPLPVRGLFVAQHQHAETCHKEAPDHAESVGFPEQLHTAARDHDGDELKDHDGVDEVRGFSNKDRASARRPALEAPTASA